MDKYECTICGYIYDEAEGDAENNVAAGTKFADLPEDWACRPAALVKTLS